MSNPPKYGFGLNNFPITFSNVKRLPLLNINWMSKLKRTNTELNFKPFTSEKGYIMASENCKREMDDFLASRHSVTGQEPQIKRMQIKKN